MKKEIKHSGKETTNRKFETKGKAANSNTTGSLLENGRKRIDMKLKFGMK